MATGNFLVQKMGRVIVSRHEAADILRKVAEMGSAGSFSNDVTCEQLGRALNRIYGNSSEENPLAEIVRGYVAAESEFHRCLLSIPSHPPNSPDKPLEDTS